MINSTRFDRYDDRKTDYATVVRLKWNDLVFLRKQAMKHHDSEENSELIVLIETLEDAMDTLTEHCDQCGRSKEDDQKQYSKIHHK